MFGRRPLLELDQYEALVLFELLSRWFNDHAMPPEECFEDRAEEAVLDAIRTRLDRAVRPEAADYQSRLAAARARVGIDWLDEFSGR